MKNNLGAWGFSGLAGLAMVFGGAASASAADEITTAPINHPEPSTGSADFLPVLLTGSASGGFAGSGSLTLP